MKHIDFVSFVTVTLVAPFFCIVNYNLTVRHIVQYSYCFCNTLKPQKIAQTRINKEKPLKKLFYAFNFLAVRQFTRQCVFHSER